MNIAASLARVEHTIGWVYNGKLLGIVALNSDRQPILYNGNHHDLRRNDDLAVMGDKIMDLILITKWYQKRDPQGTRNKFSWGK